LRNALIPTNLGIEFEGKYTELNNSFQSFKITAGIESNASWLNFYNLTGQQQKYKAWIDADNQYVRNILYNCSQLPSSIANIGKAGVQIASQSNSFSEATTSFLSAIYTEQNNNLPAKLKYGLDAEANTVFNLDLDLDIPIPVFPAVVINVGGGMEANYTNEYSLANGYWVKALPYLQTEMPNPPNPQVSFANAMGVLWNNVISGQTLTELQNVIISHLYNKVIKWFGGKSTTQNVPLNIEGSFLKINSQSIPATMDSLTSKHWKWDENQENDKISDWGKQEILSKYITGVKRLRAAASGLETGIGGYFKFEPAGYDFGDSTLISIKYPDSVVINIGENKLAVFWEDTLGIWHYLPSTPYPDSNKVTAYISHFTTYTLAPIMPNGNYGLNPNVDSIPANGISTVILTSDLIYNADSTLIGDSVLFTIAASRGTILTPDIDTTLAGIQVQTEGSIIQFQLKSDTIASPISLLAISSVGYAKCQKDIKLYDITPPAAPVLTSAIAVNNAVILKWDSVADIDLAGYKIFFDKDTPTPPYNGASSVWGHPSPVNVGMTNSYKLSGLGNDSTFYIAMKAYDISGNESNYSLPVSVFVTPPPSVLAITNDTIFSGSSNCYNATDSIIVAGNGATFIVKNGGSANLIAAKNIAILPGAKVLSGGYIHGYITGEEQFCNLLDGNVNPDKGLIFGEIPVFAKDDTFFKIYPNPTSGKFIIAINKNLRVSTATVNIYNLLGSQVLTNIISTAQPAELSLQNSPNGIYIVQVIVENEVSPAKIIKQ
jgi:hypothetical protein